jgi:hypothetical protein
MHQTYRRRPSAPRRTATTTEAHSREGWASWNETGTSHVTPHLPPHLTSKNESASPAAQTPQSGRLKNARYKGSPGENDLSERSFRLGGRLPCPAPGSRPVRLGPGGCRCSGGDEGERAASAAASQPASHTAWVTLRGGFVPNTPTALGQGPGPTGLSPSGQMQHPGGTRREGGQTRPQRDSREPSGDHRAPGDHASRKRHNGARPAGDSVAVVMAALGWVHDFLLWLCIFGSSTTNEAYILAAKLRLLDTKELFDGGQAAP